MNDTEKVRSTGYGHDLNNVQEGYPQPEAVMTCPSPSPAVEPITCQSWCQDRDGHPREKVREDQWCFGAEHRVHLSTEPSVLMSDGKTAPTYLTTYLLRQADDTAPRVFIGYDEGSGKPATFDEARRFAVEILAQVDEHGT